MKDPSSRKQRPDSLTVASKLVIELMFLLLVKVNAVKVEFWRLKLVGFVLTKQIEHDLLCDVKQISQAL